MLENEYQELLVDFHSRYSVGRHFMALRVEVLHLAVVGPLVRNVECSSDRTTVGILAAGVEDVSVVVFVEIVDGVVEGQEYDLRNLVLWKVVGDLGSGAVAVGQTTHVAGAFTSGLVRHRGGVDVRWPESRTRGGRRTRRTGSGSLDTGAATGLRLALKGGSGNAFSY